MDLPISSQPHDETSREPNEERSSRTGFHASRKERRVMKVYVVDPSATRFKRLGELEAVDGMMTTVGEVVQDAKQEGFHLKLGHKLEWVDSRNYSVCISVE